MTDQEVTNLRRRFKVNVIHRGKERWRYPRTIEQARRYQTNATVKYFLIPPYEQTTKRKEI